MAFDPKGILHICADQTIRRLMADGSWTMVAGRERTSVFYGDNLPAKNALLDSPRDLAFDKAGNLFFAERNRIRKIDASGIITTIAGTGSSTGSTNDGPAKSYALASPALAIEPAGTMILVSNKRVLRLADGAITTIASFASRSQTDEGGVAGSNISISGVALDPGGNVYLAEVAANRVWRVTQSGSLSAFAGRSHSADLVSPWGLAMDSNQNGLSAGFRSKWHSTRLS
jgi:hypothetical protein